MNLEEMKHRFSLSESQVKHLEDYFEKAKSAEVMWCESHDREWLQGIDSGCPICQEEMNFFRQDMAFKDLEDIEEK